MPYYREELKPGDAEKFKPGTILSGNWGYDQTNIDFYQVKTCYIYE